MCESAAVPSKASERVENDTMMMIAIIIIKRVARPDTGVCNRKGIRGLVAVLANKLVVAHRWTAALRSHLVPVESVPSTPRVAYLVGVLGVVAARPSTIVRPSIDDANTCSRRMAA